MFKKSSETRPREHSGQLRDAKMHLKQSRWGKAMRDLRGQSMTWIFIFQCFLQADDDLYVLKRPVCH